MKLPNPSKPASEALPRRQAVTLGLASAALPAWAAFGLGAAQAATEPAPPKGADLGRKPSAALVANDKALEDALQAVRLVEVTCQPGVCPIPRGPRPKALSMAEADSLKRGMTLLADWAGVKFP